MGLWNLLKFGLIALAVWMLYKSARRLMSGGDGGGRSRGRMRSPGPDGVLDIMVQDPQCGTYLPREEAIRTRVRGQEHFFCSEACRDAFVRGPAANSEEENS